MGYVLTQGSMLSCIHGGQAQALPPACSPRIKINQQPVMLQLPSGSYAVSGCANPKEAGGPCTAVPQIVKPAFRVASSVAGQKMHLLLMDSVQICAPTGSNLNVSVTQFRVKAL